MLDFTTQSVGKPMGVVYVERIPEVKIVDGKGSAQRQDQEDGSRWRHPGGVFGPKFQTTGLDSMKEASDPPLPARRLARGAHGHRRGARHRPQPGRRQHRQESAPR